MKKIGLISDTHSFVHPKIFDFFSEADEIWHAGDFGSIDVAEQLKQFKSLRGVYGNIDGTEIRHEFPLFNAFMCEEVKVLMNHTGGYPGRYTHEAQQKIVAERPNLFITGHSHILKVMYDKKYQMLHLNPGAAGNYGHHFVITMMRFSISGKNIADLEILEVKRNERL